MVAQRQLQALLQAPQPVAVADSTLQRLASPTAPTDTAQPWPPRPRRRRCGSSWLSAGPKPAWNRHWACPR